LVEKNGSKMRWRTVSGMPTPVSATDTRTWRPAVWRLAIVSVPPWGIASIALRMRFVSTSLSAAGRPCMSAPACRSSRSSSARLSRAMFSSQRGRVIATASCTIWLMSTRTNCSSGRRRANCWMRRTVSAPSIAADSTITSERSMSSWFVGFCLISWA
jgi:hypothetical protein